MAYIVHWDTHPSHVFRDGKGGRWAVISAVAANASARNCDVVHVRKIPDLHRCRSGITTQCENRHVIERPSVNPNRYLY